MKKINFYILGYKEFEIVFSFDLVHKMKCEHESFMSFYFSNIFQDKKRRPFFPVVCGSLFCGTN